MAGRTDPLALALGAALLTVAVAGCIGGLSPTDGADSGQDQRAPEADGGSAIVNATWPPLEEAVVRPGVRVLSGCTSSFLFRSPDNASLYLGTAGHCLEERSMNDTVSIAQGRAEGRVAFIGNVSPFNLNLSQDIGLIEILPEHRGKVHPAMLHYGGPTGPASPPSVGDTVHTYGNTPLRDGMERLNPRDGVVTDAEPPTLHANFAPPSVPGDSGSPVVDDDGGAVGWIPTVSFFYVPIPPSTTDLPSAGANGIGYLPAGLDYVRDNSDLDPRLVTWDGFSADGIGS